jgi:serine/threonine-protein kinase
MTEGLERAFAALADRYAIERELGRGGMATVFLARDLKHGRYVAVKIIDPELMPSIGSERFLGEIQAAAQLNHPHVLPLFDSGEAAGLLYYVMPYVAGESLRDRLNRDHQLPVDEAVQITREVAGALAHAHSHNLIHRDIKPDNILLSGGEAVVADFGIARAIAVAGDDRLTHTGLALGTPAYMSPEQAAGERQLDSRSDVYSLACVLYEMLVGDPPFPGANAQAVLARRAAEVPHSLRTVRASISPALERVILKALAPAPGDRWKSATEFADALRLGASGDMFATQGSRSRFSRRIATALAAVVIVGLGTIIVLLSRGRRPGYAERTNTRSDNSVAVLYFENLSPDTADAYLADGLSEEIISRLGKIDRLLVKRSSRAAIRRVRDSVPDYLVAVGRALSVQYLVEGSVRSAAGRIRIDVRLVTAADGYRVWGSQYEKPAADLLSMEAEIAGAVAAGVVGHLSSADRARLSTETAPNPEAYNRLLKGNFYFAQRDRGFDRALAEYTEALRIDPGYSRAYGRMALAYGTCSNWRHACLGLDRDSLLARGFVAAENALKLDSATADAWLALGMLRLERSPLTLAGVSEAIKEALRVEPQNAEAHHLQGFAMLVLGRDSSAIAEFHLALAIEPERPQTLHHLSGLLRTRGQFAEALTIADSAISVSLAPMGEYYEARGSLRRVLGDPAGARADAEMAIRLMYTRPVQVAFLDLDSGDTTAARRHIEQLYERLAGRPGPLDWPEGLDLARGYTALGNRARAEEVLERVRPTAAFGYGLRDPDLAPLRSDARFQRIVSAARSKP